MDGAVAATDFERALEEVEAVVADFDTKANDEEKSQREKNAALYAALERAFVFHSTWSTKPQYAKLLEQKGVAAKPRGKNASKFLPTIKVFFDAGLDAYAPTDEEGKDDKRRRQKSVSTYSAALELAAAERPNDVAAFIAQENGVEEARKRWVNSRKDTDEGREAAQKAKDNRNLRYAAGLEALKASMVKAIPKEDAPKGAAVLAALYFDDKGVAHVLGIPPASDGSTVLLEKFIIAQAPETVKAPAGTGKKGRKPGTSTSGSTKNDLDKLLKLLNLGKLAHPKAIIKIVNGEKGCDIQASHSSKNTCMANTRIARQDFLPLGTYWFGARAIASMRKFAVLGKFGAKFTIDGPSVVDGPRTTVSITATNHSAAVAAYNAAKKGTEWNDLDAVPGGLAEGRKLGDDAVTIQYETAVTKMARPNLKNKGWDVEVAVEGDFADWITKTLGVSKSSADERLKKAVYGTANLKRTTLHINATECALFDSDGAIDPICHFAQPIGAKGILTEFTSEVGEMLAAIRAVKELAGGGTVTVSLLDKLMRVRCVDGDNTAEVFIPSYVGDNRYAKHTEFGEPAKGGN